MNKLHYYNPAISPDIINHLLDQIIEIQDDNYFSPGKYVLSKCYYSIPGFARKRLPPLEKYSSRFTENDLVNGYEIFAATKICWWPTKGIRTTDEFFSALPDFEAVNTFQFFYNSFIRLQRSSQSDLPFSLRSRIDLLINRFERTGRIYDSYDIGFKPVGDSYSSAYNYILLVLCLMKVFELEKDLQLFSTALKGVDLILNFSPLIKDEDFAMSALAAIFLRDFLLREYYDYRKFRLPSY